MITDALASGQEERDLAHNLQLGAVGLLATNGILRRRRFAFVRTPQLIVGTLYISLLKASAVQRTGVVVGSKSSRCKDSNMPKPALVVAYFSCLGLSFVSVDSFALSPSQALAQYRSNVRYSTHRQYWSHVQSIAAKSPQLSIRHGAAKLRTRSVSTLKDCLSSDVTMSVEEGVRWAKEIFPDCCTVVSQATRLSGVLAEVWEKLADPSTVQEDRPCVLLIPDCPAIADARGLQGLYEHLEVCQDACERFGREVSIVPHPKSGRTGAPVAALVVQAVEGSGGGTAEGGGEFAYDPAWDGGDWDIDRSLLGEDEAEDDGGDLGISDEGVTVEERSQAVVTVAPDSDEEVTEQTKAWVQAVITDMGVCPFSVDASRAGLPVGLVRYPVSREATSEAIYRDYWREVDLLISERDERSLSTTLLIAPEFALNNAEAFEIMGQTLTQPLEALRLEDDIQLVFFHPQYSFRDGQDRIGSGGAANYARRSPFPMINILRTTQVRLAQKSIPTGLVYKQNEEVLDKVGASQLQKMLERRDWTGLEGKKVDRKHVAYYETARKLQRMEESPLAPVEAEPMDEAPRSSAKGVGSAADVANAREYLTTAAGSMRTSYDQGFFSGDDDRNDSAPVPEAIMGQTTTRASPPMETETVSGGALEAPAASSAGIADEDLRVVVTTLVKRLGSGRPLKGEADFDAFSEAVDRMLRDTAAA